VAGLIGVDDARGIDWIELAIQIAFAAAGVAFPGESAARQSMRLCTDRDNNGDRSCAQSRHVHVPERASGRRMA
jgi:hypothetical protein